MIFKPQRFHGEAPAIKGEVPVQARLEETVAEALAITDGVDATDLSVSARNGEIFLTGRLASRVEIERAVEIALGVPGVKKVSLRIESPEAP